MNIKKNISYKKTMERKFIPIRLLLSVFINGAPKASISSMIRSSVSWDLRDVMSIIFYKLMESPYILDHPTSNNNHCQAM